MTPLERLREAAAVPADDVTVSRTDLASVLEAGDAMVEGGMALRRYIVRDKTQKLVCDEWFDNLESGLSASRSFTHAAMRWRGKSDA